MKRSLLSAALFSTSTVFLTGFVFSIGTPMANAATPAAPELKGFGTDTVAGSGGRVIRVTTLASSGAGSLREALAAKGPRVIVFEVGGIIDLNKSDLRLTEPFVTIAGQTAPSPGITIIRGGMGISTHDVLMQHIRFRIGDAGTGKKSGFERDVSINGKNAYNVVIDHSSFAWGTDENLSISGPRYDGPQGTAHRITLSNNIIAEGLYDSAHTKGIHSMGTLVHDNVTDVAIVGNLYAHNNERNAWFKAGSTGVMVNNLIYNPGIWGVRVGGVKGEWEGKTMPANPRVSIAGNVMHYGANTKAGLGLVGSNSSGDVWMSDNLAYDAKGKTAPQTSGSGINVLKVSPIWPSGLTASPASAVTNQVLQRAGARPKDRDAVDKRIVEDFNQRKGRFVNSQEEVGGYPVATTTYRQLSVPSTGVDAWLQQMAKALE